MQFTFVFESFEGTNLSYLLCFIPCPVWKKGDAEIINLHPEYPIVKAGDLKTLIDIEKITEIKKLAVVIHGSGHGTPNDLSIILQELEELDLKYNLVRL
jgi:hypothetical protein